MAALFLRYLRFLLFNPNPMNQRKANITACPIQAMAVMFLRYLCYLRFLLFNSLA